MFTFLAGKQIHI